VKASKDPADTDRLSKFVFLSSKGKMTLKLSGLHLAAVPSTVAHLGVELTIGDRIYYTAVTFFEKRTGGSRRRCRQVGPRQIALLPIEIGSSAIGNPTRDGSGQSTTTGVSKFAAELSTVPPADRPMRPSGATWKLPAATRSVAAATSITLGPP